MRVLTDSELEFVAAGGSRNGGGHKSGQRNYNSTNQTAYSGFINVPIASGNNVSVLTWGNHQNSGNQNSTYQRN